MRALILASVLGLAWVAPAQTVPFGPQPAIIELGDAPPVQPVRDGCGRGWHRDRWRTQSGYWQWGHCIPNGGPHDAWSAGWYYRYPDWQVARPWWGWRYQ